MRTVIKNANVLEPYSNAAVRKDLYLDGPRICDPFEWDEHARVIDAEDKYVIPGLVDVHVHFRDPGLTHKEDILSGSKAAAAGGYTTVCVMPNSRPSLDSVETLKYIDDAGAKAGIVDVLAVSAMTKNQAGSELCDFRELEKTPTLSSKLTGSGICAISEDGISLADYDLMKEVCTIAKELGIPIMDHAEPEIEMIQRDIELSKITGCHMHIQHISLAGSVELIRQAKKDGINITCEAAPHHFALSDSAIKLMGANAKMNPPLRTEADRTAIIEGLIDDSIDIIATDHAPHTDTEKNAAFELAPNGIVGLETAFAISYTNLVKSGLMSLPVLIHKMSTRPREIIGMKTNGFVTGSMPDLIIVDLENSYVIDKNDFLSKGRNTPFDGTKVTGRVALTMHKGQITWENLKNDGIRKLKGEII